MGWAFILMSVLWIPLGAIHEIVTTEGSFPEKIRKSLIPRLEKNETETKFLPETSEFSKCNESL